MTANQVQIRRDTAGNLATSTPALAELGMDTTNERIIIGNGSDTGGIPHVNYKDHINNTFSYAIAGGTANAITVALAKSPLAYAGGFRVQFKATATNTGATTININGIGAKNLQKYTAGTLGALVAGDIVNGGIYEAVYDGTQFQLLTLQNSGLTSVSQGNLNTSTQAFSLTPNVLLSGVIYYANSAVVLSGGAYGFRLASGNPSATLSGWWEGDALGGSYSAVAWANSNTYAINGNQRYVTSSPPFDLGDGEAAGFVFALLDDKGNIVGHSASDVPPWAYNGPTNIKAERICPKTGKKYLMQKKKRSLEEYMDGEKVSYEEKEITMAMKNADMNLIPHPFLGHGKGFTPIMLDPTDERIRTLIDLQNAGETYLFADAFAKDQFRIDNDRAKCSAPKGLAVHRLTFKRGKK